MSSEQSSSISAFPQKVTLKGKRVLEEAFGGINIDIVDTMIMIRVQEAEKGMFQLYGQKSHNLVGEFGTKGRGPGEFIGARYEGQYSVDSTGINMWINDVILDRLSLININPQSLASGNIETQAFIIGAEHAYYIVPNKIIGVQASNEGRSYVTDPQNQTYLEFVTPLFPNVTIMEDVYRDGQLLEGVYFDYCKIKPDDTKFACGMSYLNRMDIFNSDSKVISSVVNEDFGEITSAEKFWDGKDVDCYYAGLAVTDDYIFATNVKEKLLKIKHKNEVEIEIYDWNGQPKYLVKTEELVLQIAVDKENKVLYGLDYHRDQIWEYDLSTLKL